MTIASKAIRGARWNTVQQLGGSIVDVTVFFLLARLLEPRDFGLVALAMAAIHLGRPVVEQGFGLALVQRADIELAHMNSVFWANMASALLLVLVLVGSAESIATLFQEPDLRAVLIWLSPGFVLLALSAVQGALIRRDMNFRALAARNLGGQLAGGFVGIAMAFLGFGVWSLVGKQLVQSATSTLLLWTFSRWRPQMQFSLSHFRDLFGFGARVTGMSYLGFLSERSVNFIIGYYLGSAALGTYSVAARLYRILFQLMASTIAAVGVPAFSRIQHDRGQVRDSFCRLSGIVAFLVFPVCAGAALVASDFIPAVFGQKWVGSTPVFAVLVLGGIAGSLLRPMGAVVLAMGRADWRLHLQMLEAALVVAGLLVAVHWGLVWVAMAIVLADLLVLPIWFLAVRQLANVRPLQYLSHLAGPIVATCIMAGMVAGTRQLLPGTTGPWTYLAAVVLTGVVVYGAVSLLVAPSATRIFVRVARRLIVPTADRQAADR